MKVQLIILKDGNVLISDDIINDNLKINFCDQYKINKIAGVNIDQTKKIIASDNPLHKLPSIDYNGLYDKLNIVKDLDQVLLNLTALSDLHTDDLDETCVPYSWAKYRKIVDLDDVIKQFELLNKPRIFNVEIEKYDSVCQKTICDDHCSMPDCLLEGEPKIHNNSIKILKICY